MNHTTTKCPACLSPFSVLTEDSTIVVWCAVGRCPSQVANDGVKGAGESSEELAQKLAKLVEDDQEW